jgi:hypothetical protein
MKNELQSGRIRKDILILSSILFLFLFMSPVMAQLAEYESSLKDANTQIWGYLSYFLYAIGFVYFAYNCYKAWADKDLQRYIPYIFGCLGFLALVKFMPAIYEAFIGKDVIGTTTTPAP